MLRNKSVLDLAGGWRDIQIWVVIR